MSERQKVRTERFCNPTTMAGYQIHVPADVGYRIGLTLCERPIAAQLLHYTDAEPTCRKCLALLETVAPSQPDVGQQLEELAARGGHFALQWTGGLPHRRADPQWGIMNRYGMVMDATLAGCVQQALELIDNCPPMTSAILARERDRRGTHPYDFVNEVHGDSLQ